MIDYLFQITESICFLNGYLNEQKKTFNHQEYLKFKDLQHDVFLLESWKLFETFQSNFPTACWLRSLLTLASAYVLSARSRPFSKNKLIMNMCEFDNFSFFWYFVWWYCLCLGLRGSIPTTACVFAIRIFSASKSNSQIIVFVGLVTQHPCDKQRYCYRVLDFFPLNNFVHRMDEMKL